MTANDSNGRVTMAVLATKLDYLAKEMAELRNDFAELREAESELRRWRTSVDVNLATLKTERTEARRDPWAYIASVIFAAAAGIGSVIFGGKQ